MLENKKSCEVKWSNEVYKLSEFVDQFPLPQFVRVAEGILNEDEGEAFGIDDILLFHDYKRILKVNATNEVGEVEAVNLSCDAKVLRVHPEFAQYRLSGREILKTLSKVKYLRFCNDDTEIGLRRNEVLSINYNSVQNQGNSFSFCIKSCQDGGRIFKINQDCNAQFQPVLDPNEFFIPDVVKRFGLPQYVLLVANSQPESKPTGSRSSEEENEKILKLENTFTHCFVTVSNTVEPNTIFHLRKNLDLSVCPTLEAVYKRTIATKCGTLNAELVDSNYEKRVSRESDEDRDIYEDMASMGLDNINLLSRNHVPPGSGQRQNEGGRVARRNAYVPTPSAIAIKPYIESLRRRTQPSKESGFQCSRPKISQQMQDDLKNPRESWYDVPKPHGTLNCCGCSADETEQHMKSDKDLIQLRFQSDDENNQAEPIYQEIDHEFREQLEDQARTKSSLKGNESHGQTGNTSTTQKLHGANRKSSGLKAVKKWSSSLRKKEVNIEKQDTTTEFIPSELQAEDSSQVHSKPSLDNSVEEIKNYQRKQDTKGDCGSYFSTDNATFSMTQRNSSSSKRSHSVGSLEAANARGNAITNALLKNKLFVSKSDSREGPPLPPPRTSSWKPDSVPITERTTASATISDDLKPNHQPTVRKSNSMSVYETSSKPMVHNTGLQAKRPTPRARVGTTPLNTTNISTDCSKKYDPKLAEKNISGSRPNDVLHGKTTGEQRENPPQSNHPILSRSTTQVDFGVKTLTNTAIKRPLPDKPGLPTQKPSCAPAERKITVLEKKPSLQQRGPSQTASSTLPRRSTPTQREPSRSSFVIPDDLGSLGISGVVECLRRINMEYLVNFFEENLIDGEMLLSLDEEVMQDMRIEKFHRLKLQKFIKGWRPSL